MAWHELPTGSAKDSLVLCELFASLESRCELDEVEVCERMKDLGGL